MGASESSEAGVIQEITEQDLQFIIGPKGGQKELGKGGMGVVYLAYWNGTPVAVKKVIDALVSDDSPNGAKYREEFIDEMQMLSSLSHPNILRLLGGSQTDSILVTEYMSRGDLFTLVQNKSPAIVWSKRGKFMARDIAHAVAAMHSKRIIHRDLKSPNILVGSEFEVKVADVGIAKRLEVGADRLKLTEDQRQYSLLWAAPEMLESDELDEKADVYSLGVIIWELLTQKPPWYHVNGPFLVSECIKRGEHNLIPDDCPDVVRDILERCWSRDPTARPSAAEVALVLSTYCSLTPQEESMTESMSSIYPTTDAQIIECMSRCDCILSRERTQSCDFLGVVSESFSVVNLALKALGYHPSPEAANAFCTTALNAAVAFQARERPDLANSLIEEAVRLAKAHKLNDLEAQFLLLQGRLLNDSVDSVSSNFSGFKKRDKLSFDQLSTSLERLQEARAKFISNGASPDVLAETDKSIDNSEALFVHDVVGNWTLRRTSTVSAEITVAQRDSLHKSVALQVQRLLAVDRADLAWNFVLDVIESLPSDQLRCMWAPLLLTELAEVLRLIASPEGHKCDGKWRNRTQKLSNIRKDILAQIEKEPKFMPDHVLSLSAQTRSWISSIFDECVDLVGMPTQKFCLFSIGSLAESYWLPVDPFVVGVLFEKQEIADAIWTSSTEDIHEQADQIRTLLRLFEVSLRSVADEYGPHVTPLGWFRHQPLLRGTPSSIVAMIKADAHLMNEPITWDLTGLKAYLSGNDDQILFDQLSSQLFYALMTISNESHNHRSSAPLTPEGTLMGLAGEVLERQMSVRQIIRSMKTFEGFYAGAQMDPSERPEPPRNVAHDILRRYCRPMVDAINSVVRFNYIVPRNPWASLIQVGTRLGVIEARFGLLSEWALNCCTRIYLARVLSGNLNAALTEDESDDLSRVEWAALRPLYRGLEISLLEKDYPVDPVLADIQSMIDVWQKGMWKNSATIDWACNSVRSFIHSRAWSTDSPRRYRDLYIKLPELLRAQMLAFLQSLSPRQRPANIQHVISSLESVPSDDGLRPSTRQSEHSWLRSVNSLVMSPTMDMEFNVLVKTDPNLPMSVLLPNLEHKVFHPNGQLIGTNDRGRHTVNSVLHDGVFIHLKAYPEWPGMEYAVGRLYELVIGRGGAPHSRIWAARAAQEHRAQWYPIGVSETIHGPTLQDVLKKDPMVPNLDRRSFSQQALLAMLVNPEDGKSDNFVLTSFTDENDRVYSRLVSIDNDHAFVPSVARKMLRPTVQVKTIIFCFNEMMLPVHPEVVEEFLLLRPEKVLRAWLRDIQGYNRDVESLFTLEEREQCLNDPNEAKRSCLSVMFRPDTVPMLFQKFRRMQDLLRANPKISHMDLLSNVEPLLAPFYIDVLRLRTSAAERFRKLAEKEYGGNMVAGAGVTKTTTTRTLESALGGLPTTEDIRRPAKFSIENAIASLDEIDLKQGTIDAVRASVVQKGDYKPLRALPFEEMKQAVLDGIEVSTLPPEIQRAVVRGLWYSELTVLNLEGCVVADQKLLTPVLESSKRLTVLNLSGCPLVNSTTLEVVSKCCPQLAKLYLQDLKNLTALSQSNVIGRSALDFWSLRRLFVDGCDKLEEILIVAPSLTEMSCKGCLKLKLTDLYGVIRHSDLSRIILPEGYSVRIMTSHLNYVQDRPDRPGLLSIHATTTKDAVVCVHSNGMLSWFDVNSAKLIREKDLGKPIISAEAVRNVLCLATDAKFAPVASSGANSRTPAQLREPAPIEVVDIDTGESLRSINAYATHISCDNAFLACCIVPLGVQLRDCVSGQLLQRIGLFPEAEQQAMASSSSDTNGEDTQLPIATNVNPIATQSHLSTENIHAFCLSGERVFAAVHRRAGGLTSSSASKSYSIKVWSVIEEDICEELVVEPAEVPIVAIQRIGDDGHTIVVTQADGCATMFDRLPGRLQKTTSQKIKIPLLELQSGGAKGSQDVPAVPGPCIGSLGPHAVLMGSEDGAVRCWSSKNAVKHGDSPLFTLLGHSAPVAAVAGCGDNFIVSGTAFGALRFCRVIAEKAAPKKRRVSAEPGAQ